ncbi:MAG TPA: 2OG-Fe(II) oxygenase [Pyrinomonadaceae bacterium]|nr:2OG-Fe(II) oxygenase [Pyrinomonadaceae bacterium]
MQVSSQTELKIDSDPSTEASLFLLHGFLDPQTCASLREEAYISPTTKAPVYMQGSPENVHENVRKTTSFHPSADTVAAIHDKLSLQKSALENHFGLSLTDCERPQFLLYQPGDFFVRHQDGNTNQLDFDHLRIRRISLVVFLNDSCEEERVNTFSGGSLHFYGRDYARANGPAHFTLKSETGLLVAFSADMVHEVSHVTRGQRFTIISWFR